jgi:phosphatidylglycerophosphatase A
MEQTQQTSVRITGFDRFVLFLGEGLGLGRIPFAPGTFGSLWGIAIGWCFWVTSAGPWIRIAVFLAMFFAGVPICARSATLRGRKDPGSVVWDEMTAFPLVYLLVPLNWWLLLAGFIVFRFFDIAKPWPIRQFEQLPSGLGIMADDQIAGGYSAIVLFVLHITCFA